MDICKFFREGYCRFGSRCRYLHQSSNNYSYGYSDNNSYGKYYGDEYNTKSRQQKGYSGGSSNNSDFNNYRNDNSDQRYKSGSTNNSANQNAYDLWTLIEKEIKILEEGHQWALSCFSVSREYGNVPGWEDHSPEELRYEMYKAIKDGTFEQCKNSITQLYKNAEERRNDFKSKARALPILEALLREKDRRENSNVAANNTQEQNTNLWQNRGVNQQSTGLFGGSSNSAALFGANSSSAQQTNGIFGGNSSSAQQMPGLFAGNSSSTQQMQGLFAGNSSPSQQMPGLFGGNSNSTQIQQSIFGNNQFSNPGETFSFGLNQQQQQQQQIQAQINPSNGFLAGANSVSSPMFQSGASPFQTEQSTQNNPSFFQPMAQQSPQMASSPFNQPVNSSQSVFKPSSEMASSNNQMDYSQQTDLTESELAAFQAKAFKFGHIPLKPPLKEVC